MRAHIRLGRIFGIEVGLHYSWFFIALLIVFTLGGYFRSINPGWSEGVVWSLAVLTALLFFVSLVLHELAHSLVARSKGLPVRSITLFALGGVAQIENGSRDARTEFLMAIAGPVMSAALGAIALLLAALGGWAPAEGEHTPLIAMLAWLGYINLGLAMFNMLPGYPMDGGRVLRAIVWWKTGDAHRSTRVAARAGQVVGALFILWGLARAFAGAGLGGLWMAFIGWFLVQMASESHAQAAMLNVLAGVRVGDIMARDCPTVDGYTNVQSFITDTMLRTERRLFVVETNGSVAGIVGPAELSSVERTRWPFTTMNDIARPIEDTAAVEPETLVTDALELMARDHLSLLPVVSHGHLDGILSRRQVAQFLQTRTA